MSTNMRPWTRHKIRNSALKQLSAAVNREDGSLFPGVGHGAASSRAALLARGLAEEVEQEMPRGYVGNSNIVITEAGREALAEARQEGW